MVQVEALGAAEAEAAVIEVEQLQAAALERARTDAAAIRITGAQGVNTGAINGVYKLQKEGKRPVWKQCDAELYLYRASTNEWWVSDAEDKDARKAQGLASSEALGPQSLPTDVCKWEVDMDDGMWEEQQLKVRLDH